MITYIMLSIAVIFFAALDYAREKAFNKYLSLLQDYFIADGNWSREVNNKLTELEEWIEKHDKKEKNK